jgi:hypothetical protein
MKERFYGELNFVKDPEVRDVLQEKTDIEAVI